MYLSESMLNRLFGLRTVTNKQGFSSLRSQIPVLTNRTAAIKITVFSVYNDEAPYEIHSFLSFISLFFIVLFFFLCSAKRFLCWIVSFCKRTTTHIFYCINNRKRIFIDLTNQFFKIKQLLFPNCHINKILIVSTDIIFASQDSCMGGIVLLDRSIFYF